MAIAGEHRSDREARVAICPNAAAIAQRRVTCTRRLGTYAGAGKTSPS